MKLQPSIVQSMTERVSTFGPATALGTHGKRGCIAPVRIPAHCPPKLALAQFPNFAKISPL